MKANQQIPVKFENFTELPRRDKRTCWGVCVQGSLEIVWMKCVRMVYISSIT